AARIGFFLTYPSTFESVLQVLSIWQGGLVSYWGMVAGIAIAFMLIKKERGEWFDAFAVALMVGWAVGRLGNYYAGDSGGVESEFFSVFYGQVPIQLFESALCLAVAGGAFRLWKKQSIAPGMLAWYVLAAYCAGRFIIDAWRDEPAIGFFHISQIVSLAGVCILLAVKPWYERALKS
ncbi:MAG: prolipoprotein diacylglyceryl transferase, phosphatidylglycerol:prolipoprotein diacylglycerol, partial [Patescibacteria group bacterium]|nr:prolipoprotein diacylglyceryl transferase, phosphatidylglycerol:prolipoprotein diacylglycerol [Patescibacteria group bacterium]